ncbi:hypothetical protein [Tepidibacter hydrothermalis]|uniref:Uncharacterized protein n=1 Tax=Tepidibacter hydrothermalis TaxID=3036126 RepID=A0ABY8E7A1_9FIRM|nr:hypothetical protein [Tepidibacter hydrothermalis]WFD08762.1 hypothetical protein P4S50_10165 [Tepidibacter hydrothermalis]
MSNIKLSRNELLEHLEEQIEFLESSAKLFDEGKIAESKRIATTIRVLLHDTKNSTSLLQLLDKKENMLFFDSSEIYNPKNIAGQYCLLDISMNPSHIGFVPRMYIGPTTPKKCFDDWWNEIVISTTSDFFKGDKFSRKDIILALSNKDGGAHVDQKLKEDYFKLTRENSMELFGHFNGNNVFNANSIASFTARVIVFELLVTLFTYFPQYNYSTIAKSKEKPKNQFPNLLKNFEITIKED